MRYRSRRLALASALALAGLLTPMIVSAASGKPDASLAAAGLDGSKGSMQSMTLPARISRVAVVPGSGGAEAWAIGHMERAQPDWSAEQVVFLHYIRGAGWSLYGPPLDSTNQPARDLVLGNLSISSNGEGWAVGTQGTLVHLSGGQWRYSSACGSGRPMPQDSCGDLLGVSIVNVAGHNVGYAVGSSRGGGSANTILALNGSTWTLDGAAVVPDPTPVLDFVAVASVNADDAWAVAGTSSRELQIFRRTAVGWVRQRTNQPIFDNPAPSVDGRQVNLSAQGTSVAVTPTGNTVWIGGGIYPVDASSPLNQADMPFTIRWSGSFTTYCPPQYSLSNDDVSISDICDKRMPIAPYDVSALSVLPNGEVFAAGLGLYHYKSDVWWREPDTLGYLSSVSFSSSTDGWVASSGNTIGGGRAAASSSNSVGHYTPPPLRSRTARWPHFNKTVLYGAATSTGGRTLAVGANGSSLLYTPGIGWQQLNGSAGGSEMHSVAWTNSQTAWAVGKGGAIAVFRGDDIDVSSAASSLTRSDLNAVAVSGNSGFAVGDRGTILRLSNGAWSKDPSSETNPETLWDVASTGSGFVAVGANATILRNPSGAPGAWSRDDSLASVFSNSPTPPNVFAIDTLQDGTLVVGGGPKFIAVQGSGAEAWQRLSPLDGAGSIIDLQSSRTSRGIEVIAAFSESDQRFSTRRTSLMRFDGSQWDDLGMSDRRTAFIGGDGAGIPDPVFSIAMESSGKRGWAVGGSPANVPDDFGGYNSNQSSAILRWDLTADPAPTNTDAPVQVPQGLLNFAYFSESSCGKSFCSLAVGSGTKADEVALRIRDSINAASLQEGGPKFVIFGGNMRSVGIPEEIEEFRGYLTGFRIPVFGAMGPQDVLSSSAVSQAQSLLPSLPDEDLNRAGLKPPDTQSAVASNRDYLRSFKEMYEPWGTGGNRYPTIRPVQVGLGADDNFARTHYAFDYVLAGKALARFVVLDTSDRFFQKTGQALKNQNPSGEDQSTWLADVVVDATRQIPPLPVIAVMSVPSVDPLRPISQPQLADGKTFEAAALSNDLSAVLTGFVRANASYLVQAGGNVKTIPFYVLGGGGAPPKSTEPKYPSDGYYHSWALVSVDPTGVSLLQRQARVDVRPIPVVESVALHAVQGLQGEGGWPLTFAAMAHAVVGGGPPGDPNQTRMSYLTFPSPPPCLHDGFSGGGFCTNRSALSPDYHFISEDTTIAAFVRPGAGVGNPAVVNGFLIPDDQLGFLCTFKTGTVWVKIVSGLKQMRLPVTVGPGFGPCVDHPILAPPKIPLPRLPNQPVEPEPRHLIFRPPVIPDTIIVALPPVPAPIPAPAPPASAAGARKEEEEAQFEEQGDEGENAAARVFREDPVSGGQPADGWLYMMAAVSAAMMLALATGSVSAANRRAPRANYAEWRSR